MTVGNRLCSRQRLILVLILPVPLTTWCRSAAKMSSARPTERTAGQVYPAEAIGPVLVDVEQATALSRSPVTTGPRLPGPLEDPPGRIVLASNSGRSRIRVFAAAVNPDPGEPRISSEG
jgi:hypothetical protein